MRILISGGAGFVGSHLARAFKEADSSADITVLDNLKRRGSELNLALLRCYGIAFEHGDIRSIDDLEALSGQFDLFIEASAEPSVHAGAEGSPAYLLQTNLAGTLNCLEFARRRAGCFLFLSTSRVYSIAPLRALRLEEMATRYEIAAEQEPPGVTPHGVAEAFPTHLPRSLYGASKLASELIIQEYAHTYSLRAIINRCGVIAGPGQFGKVDQGVFTLWVAHHFFGKPLRYTGFGGTGKQVRDLLHPDDLFALLRRQLASSDNWSGEVYNVGGGRACSTSLLELTELCRTVVGNNVPVTADAATAAVDIPLFIADTRCAEQEFGWQPERDVNMIVSDIADWLRQNEAQLAPLFS